MEQAKCLFYTTTTAAAAAIFTPLVVNKLVRFQLLSGTSNRNSAGKGRPHCDNSRVISTSFKSSLSCFKKPLHCIFCIPVCFFHRHTFPDIWIGIEYVIAVELRC